jgi:hypothetical protein
MQDTLDILCGYGYDDDFVEHHGVKGMHWGVRRQQRIAARNKHYRKNLKVKDLSNAYATYGKGGVKRISKNVDKGYSLSESKALETRRSERNKKIAKAAKTAGIAAASLGAGYAVGTVARSVIRNKVIDFYNSKMFGNTSLADVKKANITRNKLADLGLADRVKLTKTNIKGDTVWRLINDNDELPIVKEWKEFKKPTFSNVHVIRP